VSDVPEWCAFFDDEQYELFCGWMDDACSCYGAEGQDLSEGIVELAVATADTQIHAFALARLASRCRDHPPADWDRLCSDQVDDWVTAEGQHEWLERASFDQVRASLWPRLSQGHPRFVGTAPDDPRETFRRKLADGLWLNVVADEVPGRYGDEPQIDVEVHHGALASWGIDGDELLRIALDNTRRARPQWREQLVEAAPGDPIPLRVARNRGSYWVPLLGEEYPDAMFIVPLQGLLMICPDPDAAGPDRAAALLGRLARRLVRKPGYERVSTGVYRLLDGGYGVCVAPDEELVDATKPEPADQPARPRLPLGVAVESRTGEEILASWLAHRTVAFPRWAADHAGHGPWDYSPESLDRLDALVRAVVRSPGDVADPAHGDLLNGAAWYFGEMLIRVKGGEWACPHWLGGPSIVQRIPHGDLAVPVTTIELLVDDPVSLRDRLDRFGPD
jgi:hypothetical protein